MPSTRETITPLVLLARLFLIIIQGKGHTISDTSQDWFTLKSKDSLKWENLLENFSNIRMKTEQN